MKLLMAIVHSKDRNRVTGALLTNQFKFTQIGSSGGFLREGNATYLIGLEDDQVDEALKIIDENCRTREQYVNVLPPDASPLGSFYPTPVKVQVGGAVVFVIDVERSERF
ncbi:MAG: cyclic-di-AMP receptor [Armatimonadetes bacterium]|nr:cyclic-di-AMP receptor [Armatimonadota bacterium]